MLRDIFAELSFGDLGIPGRHEECRIDALAAYGQACLANGGYSAHDPMSLPGGRATNAVPRPVGELLTACSPQPTSTLCVSQTTSWTSPHADLHELSELELLRTGFSEPERLSTKIPLARFLLEREHLGITTLR